MNCSCQDIADAAAMMDVETGITNRVNVFLKHKNK